MKINFSKTLAPRTETVVFLIGSDKALSSQAQAWNTKSGGFLARVLKTHGKFSGAHGQVLVRTLPDGAGAVNAVFFGVGAPEKLTTRSIEILGGKLLGALEGAGIAAASVFLEGDCGAFAPPDVAAHLAAGAKLQDYRFDRYKKISSSREKSSVPETRVQKISFVLEKSAVAEKVWSGLDIATDGTLYVRDLVNEPPNRLYPDSFARRVQDDLKPLGVDVTIYDEKKLKTMGHAAHLAVGMGSDHPPRLVVLQWNGAGKGTATRKAEKGPIVFVGKGLTFDAGGLNLKPTGGIEDMKLDMAGAATVAGLFMALARRKAKVNAIGILGMAENMISGHSYRPSDIIDTLSGKTVEVGNTDAEGRLVLADCLTYAQKKFSPCAMIDLATLTGAMMVALGNEYCGTFANDDSLWSQMDQAGRESGEKIWRMPLDEAWRKEDEGTISDLVNIGAGRPNAGACTAAGFLEHFIEDGTVWAHMDIAGVSWVKSARPNLSKGGTGYGVRLLDRLIAAHFEGR